MTNEEGKSLQVSCLCTSYQRQYASTHEKEEKLIEILVKKKTFLYAALRFTSVVPWIHFLKYFSLLSLLLIYLRDKIERGLSKISGTYKQGDKVSQIHSHAHRSKA